VFVFILMLSTIFFKGTPAFAQLEVKWSGGEHLELGLEGVLLACESLDIPQDRCPGQTIARADKKFSFKYGEILTSADYYNTPEEFYKDKKSNIVRAIKCAYKQKNSHLAQRNGEAEASDCRSTGIWSLPGYLEVVSQNYAHFGWNNMVAYVNYHGKALLLAQRGHELKATQPATARDLFNKALVYNAFADHYLTDAFASGHIRVPRIQIKRWAKDQFFGVFRASRGDLLTMYLHNIESQNLHTKKEQGLRVRNSLGDIWLTRGDGNLNLYATDSDPTVVLPKTALAESFKDVLIAWSSGEVPTGIYEATLYVPFQDDMPLLEKLSPGYQKVRRQKDVTKLIFSNLSIFERLIFNKSDFNGMLDNLERIFHQFRRDVAHEQEENPQLKNRLPEKYLQAYLLVE